MSDVPADHPPADRPPLDQPPLDDRPVDRPPADNPPADRPPLDQPPLDRPPEDRPPLDRPPTDNPPPDRPPPDRPPIDSPPLDAPPADLPPVDHPPTDAGAALIWPDLLDIRACHASAHLQIHIDPPSRTTRDSDALAARWATLCAANPRFHDGPILAVSALDVITGTVQGLLAPIVDHINARVDSYRRLAVQPQVRTGVRLLGVTSIITALDESGDTAVLLARRAPDVRVYPNLWELGPSGGVNVPPPTVHTLDAPLLARAAFDEIEEEIGEAAASFLHGASNFLPFAIIRDDQAFSDDVVLRMTTPAPFALRDAIRTGWEYAQTQWVLLRDLDAWARANPCIPPTHAIIRMLATPFGN